MLLGLLLLLVGPAALAQAPTWQTATLLTIPSAPLGYSSVQATAADANGNIYLVGNFLGYAYFGSTTLYSGSNDALFIAKWNSVSNSFAWAQKVDGGASSFVSAAAVTVSGNNIFLAGTFSGTAVDFGGILLDAPTSKDAFVAKLVETGGTASFVWVKRTIGTGDEVATGLALNGTTAYLTGTYGGSGHGGPATFDNTTLPNSSTSTTDIFVAKLTDSGSAATFGWALRVGGSNDDVAHTIAANGSTVYLGGNVTGPVPFGSIPTYTASGRQTCFLAKLTDAGTSASFSWVQLPQGYVDIFSLAVNGNTVYAAGEFNYQTLFGSVPLSTAGALDGFVVKLTDAGATSSFVWGYRFGNGGSRYDGARALAVSGRTLYVAGYTEPQSFLAGLTDMGATARENWTKIPQSSNGVSYAYAVTIAAGGAVYLAGNTGAPITFDAIGFNFRSYSGIGFLASLTDPILLAATAAQDNLSFTLAPNPALAAAVLTLPARRGAATASFTLLDALGRALRFETLALPPAGLRHEISLVGLPAGLYALRVAVGPATATRRLVVE